MKARRYNQNKARYDLVPSKALEKIIDVYTKGAHKYSIYVDENGNEYKGSETSIDNVEKLELKLKDSGADNWRKGLPWMDCIASAQRHIEAWKQGEDIDKELGTYHLANAAWNLLTLLEYYRIHPELDNRKHKYLSVPKIGLDIDEVICDWVGHWVKRHNMVSPEFWNFDKDIDRKFEEIKDDKEFWITAPPKIDTKDMPFEPHCYITSRICPQEWTEEWIQANGFPTVPVYTVPHNTSKVQVAKEAGVEWFVDDRYQNFVELNKAGICCFLFDAPHNQRYNVGYKRIKSLWDLLNL